MVRIGVRSTNRGSVCPARLIIDTGLILEEYVLWTRNTTDGVRFSQRGESFTGRRAAASSIQMEPVTSRLPGLRRRPRGVSVCARPTLTLSFPCLAAQPAPRLPLLYIAAIIPGLGIPIERLSQLLPSAAPATICCQPLLLRPGAICYSAGSPPAATPHIETAGASAGCC